MPGPIASTLFPLISVSIRSIAFEGGGAPATTMRTVPLPGTVRPSLVRARRNPITGALVVADVVLREDAGSAGAGEVEREILRLCREGLTQHKVPTAIRFVPALAVAATGKLARSHA